MRVARTKGIEDHGAVGQQVFHALLAEADRFGKHAQRIGLGDVGDRIDPPASNELLRKFLGRFLETCAQARHRLCRQCSVHHRTAARMQWRIGLEDEARRAPWLGAAEIVDADAGRRAECLPIAQRCLHFGIPGACPQPITLKPHYRPGFAQFRVKRIGHGEEIVGERIEGRNRTSRHRKSSMMDAAIL